MARNLARFSVLPGGLLLSQRILGFQERGCPLGWIENLAGFLRTGLMTIGLEECDGNYNLWANLQKTQVSTQILPSIHTDY